MPSKAESACVDEKIDEKILKSCHPGSPRERPGRSPANAPRAPCKQAAKGPPHEGVLPSSSRRRQRPRPVPGPTPSHRDRFLFPAFLPAYLAVCPVLQHARGQLAGQPEIKGPGRGLGFTTQAILSFSACMVVTLGCARVGGFSRAEASLPGIGLAFAAHRHACCCSHRSRRSWPRFASHKHACADEIYWQKRSHHGLLSCVGGTFPGPDASAAMPPWGRQARTRDAIHAGSRIRTALSWGPSRADATGSWGCLCPMQCIVLPPRTRSCAMLDEKCVQMKAPSRETRSESPTGHCPRWI